VAMVRLARFGVRRHLALIALLVAFVPSAVAASPRPAVRSSGEKPRRAKAPKTTHVDAIAIQEHGLSLQPYTYEESSPLPKDGVEVVVHASCLNSGDLQQCRGDWGPCLMPLVPGREAVGVVAKVGASVKGLVPGDRVAVLMGTGLDSEADDDGADRSTLDTLTTGTAARRLRVPARWAFELPLSLPSTEAVGLLGAGGAVWAQLTARGLGKGSKVAVLGQGATATLALQLAEALGMETYAISDGAEGAVPSTATEVVDVTSADHQRLHTGSFDALLVISTSSSLDLGTYLPFVARGGSVLVANSPTGILTLSPRILQERRLSVLAPPALSRKATLAMLGFCAAHDVEWPATSGEFSVEGAAAAFATLEDAPGARAVLVEGAEHAKWRKRAKKLIAAGAKGKGAPGGATVVGSAAAAASAASAASISSVFGVFSKVRESTAQAAAAVTDSIQQTTRTLVEQVEKEVVEEEEMRHGALQLGGEAAPAVEDGDDDDDDDDEEEEDDDDE